MTANFFEGVEKLLEIWFQNPLLDDSANDGGCQSDLRRIPRSELDSLVAIAHCRIISSMSNDHMDSYVLSESSMFVSASRFILKTCGKTTPLSCLENLLKLVTQYTSYTAVKDLFYSRKNFVCPNLQETTYRSFNAEIEVLQSMFPGSAHCLGRVNGDCWYIYSLDRCHIINNITTANIGACENDNNNNNSVHNKNTLNNTNKNSVNNTDNINISSNSSIIKNNNKNTNGVSYSNGEAVSDADWTVRVTSHDVIRSRDHRGDQTLEILMLDLDARVMEAFYSGPGCTAERVTQSVGIDKLIDGMKIDATLFEPCGYSMNALLDKDHYLTVHVTPEPGYSYVSLETNVAAECYQQLIGRVVACFRPRRTLITLFANDWSRASGFVRAMSIKPAPPYLLNMRDLQYSRLRDYHLLYAFFDR